MRTVSAYPIHSSPFRVGSAVASSFHLHFHPHAVGSPAPLRNLHRIENQQIHPPACHMTWLEHGNCFKPQVSRNQPILDHLGQLGRSGQLDQLVQLIQLDQSARRETPFLKLRQPLAPALVRAARQYRAPYVVNYRPRKQRRGWLRLRTGSPYPAPHAHTTDTPPDLKQSGRRNQSSKGPDLCSCIEDVPPPTIAPCSVICHR